MAYQYILDIPGDYRKDLALLWLWLAVITLLGAGIFSILLVLARTPVIGALIPFVDFFHTALVIHVNFSTLIWILSFACMLWSLNTRPVNAFTGRSIFTLAVVGTVLMAVSPFTGDGRALMSNYIPVLDGALFLSGLGIYAVAMGLQVLYSMSSMLRVGKTMSGQGVIRFGLNCAAIGVFVALAAFVWSWIELPGDLANETYFEVLFWGGGHVLQFSYTLLMMVAWLWLSTRAGLSLPISPRVALFLFAVGLVSIFLTPIAYYAYEITSVAYRRLFTLLMSFGGSLAIFPLAIALVYALCQYRAREQSEATARTALITSLVLFGTGGIIGFLIEGNNVRIPAHYHGCIVGVTLALMGLAYQLLPPLGFSDIGYRVARLQLWIYSSGQLLHILGLVWSGGYGTERKVADAAQGYTTSAQAAGMGLMGAGGLLAAIGGFLFIIIVIRALMTKHDRSSATPRSNQHGQVDHGKQ